MSARTIFCMRHPSGASLTRFVHDNVEWKGTFTAKLLALLLPFAAAALQWTLWPILNPLVWILFFPAVFFSAALGGLRIGLLATVAAGVLGWSIFIQPEFTLLAYKGTRSVISTMVFTLMGGIFSYFWGRFLDGHARTARLLEQSRLAESSLRASEARFRNALDNAPIGMAIKTLDGRFDRVNPALCRILGYEEEQLTQLKFQDITSPADLSMELQLLQSLLDNDAPSYTIEKRYIRKGGDTVWTQLTCSLLRDEQGAPEYYIAQIEDIEKRRAALEFLIDLTMRHTLALRAGAIGVWDWDLHTNTISWDAQMRELYGVAEDGPVTYETWRACVHPDDIAAAESVLKAAVSEQVASENHFRITLPDGSIRHIDAAEEVIKDADGRAIRVIGVNRDVTDEVVANIRIKESEALQRSIFEESPEAILVVGQSGVIQSTNEQVSLIFGYGKDELLNKPVDDLLPTRYRHTHAGLRKSFAGTPRRRTMGMGADLYGQRANGEEFPVDVMLSPLAGSSGSVIVTIRDATENKRRERLIAAALEEKEVLLREVYHRVKNNLQVITSLFNLQMRTLPPGAARVSLSEGADRVRAMSLLHEKLYRSQDLSSIDMRDYIDDLCQRLAITAAAEQRGIKLISHLESISIGMDTALPVGLIVNELFTNCLKHAYPSGRRGEIHVTTAYVEAEQPNLTLTVVDDGVGLPAAFNVAASATLGMKLVDRLTGQLFGTFEISSTGHGTVATVSFPMPDPLPTGRSNLIQIRPSIKAYANHTGALS